jgi:hypothetical protein
MEEEGLKATKLYEELKEPVMYDGSVFLPDPNSFGQPQASCWVCFNYSCPVKNARPNRRGDGDDFSHYLIICALFRIRFAKKKKHSAESSWTKNGSDLNLFISFSLLATRL